MSVLTEITRDKLNETIREASATDETAEIIITAVKLLDRIVVGDYDDDQGNVCPISAVGDRRAVEYEFSVIKFDSLMGYTNEYIQDGKNIRPHLVRIV
jgi:hypothetical protein